MSREQRLDKVWNCVRRVLSDPAGEDLLGRLEDLENVADISAVMAILGQKSPTR